MLQYPVTLMLDTNGSFLVTFSDVPEANSVGDDEDEALLNALDALESALEIYVDQRRPVPTPSKPECGQAVVALPALESSKVLIWNEMLAKNIKKVELARLLHVHMPQIDRLFDMRHSSKLEFVERAAAVLGRKLSISLA